MPETLQTIRTRYVESAGHLSQSLGAGRAIGQVFAHIYFSPRPQTLDDLTDALGISKGSASMCVRQLEQWSALRRVWVKGDRKDYYEASTEFGDIVRRLLSDFASRAVETSDTLLAEAEALLAGAPPRARTEREEWEFVSRRVRLLRLFRERVEKIWHSPAVKLVLRKRTRRRTPH